MYKQVETDPVFKTTSYDLAEPVATLENGNGSVCQIVYDGGCCYIIYMKQSNGLYAPSTHIFKEVLDVLKTLPPLELGMK